MKETIVLDQLINDNNARIKLFRRHLSDHENGENHLTKVIKASTEVSLEAASEKVRKYKEMQDILMVHDTFDEKMKEKIVEAIHKKRVLDSYTQKDDNPKKEKKAKKSKKQELNKQLEVMLVVDELTSELEIEQDELFNIASKSLFLNEDERNSLENKLVSINENFSHLLKKIDKELIKKVSSFNYRIPILILHFWILSESLKTTYERRNQEFRGFPRYEDWWISELWSSHQSYYGLLKLKDIIAMQCITPEQKQSWEKIFDNWLAIKLYLGSKGELAYPYLSIFDNMVATYTGFEEEISEDNLTSMEKLINTKIIKEDFTKVSSNHTTITSYMRFKKKDYLRDKIEK